MILRRKQPIIMKPDWRGAFGMYIRKYVPLQENANLAELTLAEGYYGDLSGRLVIGRDHMAKLGLKEGTEIAITIGGKEWIIEEEECPCVLLTARVTGFSTKKSRNLWSNFADGAKYIDYVDISITFKEFDATGNLFMVQEHMKPMELALGDTLYLKVQKVKSS